MAPPIAPRNNSPVVRDKENVPAYDVRMGVVSFIEIIIALQ
jgi:hypothetical protein